MRLLVDMNLSPCWLPLLAEAGIEAAHWSMLGAKNAPDAEIMAFAKARLHSAHARLGLQRDPGGHAWR